MYISQNFSRRIIFKKENFPSDSLQKVVRKSKSARVLRLVEWQRARFLWADCTSSSDGFCIFFGQIALHPLAACKTTAAGVR